jgi:hypothetical protein
MGFSEFARGMSAEEIEYLREREISRQLREQHRRMDDHLTILRPSGDKLPGIEDRFQLWKDSRTL